MKEIASFQNGTNIVGLPEIVIIVEEKKPKYVTFRLGSYTGREKIKLVSEIDFKTIII